LRAEVSRLCEGRAAVVASRLRTRGLRPLDASGEGVERGTDAASPAAAFCAVGNPRAFFEHLRREGFKLLHTRAFPDHHAYAASEVEAFAREAVRRGARGLLTTAKDAVKLRGFDFALPCYVVETEMEFEDEAALLGLLRKAASATR
jgi:tetraacyldisaccharide 4'-kinase